MPVTTIPIGGPGSIRSGSIRAATPSRRRGRAADDAFVLHDPAAPGPDRASSLPPMPPQHLVDVMQASLLGLQDEPTALEVLAKRRANRLLAGLSALQSRLLTDGGDDGAALADLRSALQNLPRPPRGDLASILDSISLRVEVELARREQVRPASDGLRPHCGPK